MKEKSTKKQTKKNKLTAKDLKRLKGGAKAPTKQSTPDKFIFLEQHPRVD